MGRRHELSKQTRKQIYMKRRRAQLRMQKWMEDNGELSFPNICNERLATTHKVKAKAGRKKIKELSTDIAISKMVNERPLDVLKEEDHENLSGTQNIPLFKLEFETEEEMESRWNCENHVKVEKEIKSFKVEPVEGD